MVPWYLHMHNCFLNCVTEMEVFLGGIIYITFFKPFILYLSKPINNVVIVSGAQQSNSAIHIPVSILSHTPFPSRLQHNTEQSSLCHTVGLCWYPFYLFIYFFGIHFKYSSVYMSIPNSLTVPSPNQSCLGIKNISS